VVRREIAQQCLRLVALAPDKTLERARDAGIAVSRGSKGDC
jgi:hypothetical protein